MPRYNILTFPVSQMANKIIWILIISLSGCSTSLRQTSPLNALDVELKEIFHNRFTLDYSKKDSITKLLELKMTNLLKDSVSFDYPFDSLSTEIKILRSTDNRLKIYSWDELSGGTAHDMSVYAQFKDKSGEVRFQRLDSGDADLSGYSESLIYELYTVLINDTTNYLTLGYGTFGGGHYHSIVQIFKIESKKLVKGKDCFVNPLGGNSMTDLVIVAPRSEKIKLKYYPESQELIYNEFVYGGDDSGSYYPTGFTVTLKLINGKFQKIHRDRVTK
jgi:hypothetical protein